MVTEQVDWAMDAALGRLAQADRHIERSRELTDRTEQLLQSATAREERHRQVKALWWKRRMPFIALSVVGIVLVLPHSMARPGSVCDLLGGRPFHDPHNDNARVCGFYEWR